VEEADVTEEHEVFRVDLNNIKYGRYYIDRIIILRPINIDGL
jgi:hypothetical protein